MTDIWIDQWMGRRFIKMWVMIDGWKDGTYRLSKDKCDATCFAPLSGPAAF